MFCLYHCWQSDTRVQQCSCLSTSLAVPTHALLTTPHLKPWQECDLGWGSSQVQSPNSLLVLARQLPCKQHHAQSSPNAQMLKCRHCVGVQAAARWSQYHSNTRRAELPFKEKTSERTSRQTEGIRERFTDFLPWFQSLLQGDKSR